MRNARDLNPAEAAVLAHIRGALQVETAHGLAQDFVAVIRKQPVDQLDPWLDACEASGITVLRTFAEGLRQDYDAVRAALELPWSSGQAEGQINRLKMLKRQMYDRASFGVLRARVLRAA
jgi:transposase